MNKEIEKYIWYYLGVYIVVLLTFAAFQYFGVCDGESLNCKTNWEKVKDILQTTAYILTPIVAIIGFLSWKVQKQYELEQQQLHKTLEYLNHIFTELIIIRSNSVCIRTTENNFSYYPEIIKRDVINIDEYLYNMYSHINTYCEIKDDKYLEEKYHYFEKICSRTFGFYNILLEEYKEYLYIAEDNLLNKNKFSYEINYDDENHSLLLNKRRDIKKYLDTTLINQIIDKDGNLSLFISQKYFDYLEEAINLNIKMKKICIDAINLKKSPAPIKETGVKDN